MWLHGPITVDLRKIRLTQTDDQSHAVRPLHSRGRHLIPTHDMDAALHGGLIKGFCCTNIPKNIVKGLKKL